jgi:hypothetical protein
VHQEVDVSPWEIAVVVALEGFSVYKQTKAREFKTGHRFAVALLYALVGGALGISLPHDATTLLIVAVSLVASVAVGVFGGRHVQLWRRADGRVFSRGTGWTIALLVALVGAKIGASALAALTPLPYHATLGEVLLMIGIMLAVENLVVGRRARALRGEATAVEYAG